MKSVFYHKPNSEYDDITGEKYHFPYQYLSRVKKSMNDWIRNGIALSGTVHWMFDRGLLSLDNDFTIMQSRQLNYDVSHLIHKDSKAKVPQETRLQPHPKYLEWHRENIFKL